MKQSTKQKIQDGLDKGIDVANRLADEVQNNEDAVRRTILVVGVGLIVYRTMKKYTPQNVVHVNVTAEIPKLVEAAKTGLEIETVRTIVPDPYPKDEIKKLFKLEISDKDVHDMTEHGIAVIFDVEDKNFILMERPDAIEYVMKKLGEKGLID